MPPETPSPAGGLITASGSIAAMLDLRLRSGVRTALPYSYLGHVEFDPSSGIVCRFATATVTVRGRNLSPIYTAITTQTAIAIVESETPFDEGGDGSHVESITIQPAE